MATAASQGLVGRHAGSPAVTGRKGQAGEEPRADGRRRRCW